VVAKQRKRPARPRRDRKDGSASGWRKPCPYCRDKVDRVDYKDVSALRRFISGRGKIRSRRITGACRRHQSQVARAVKRARACAVAVRRRGRERALGTRRAVRSWLAPRQVADSDRRVGLGRSLRHVVDLIARLEQRHVAFRSLREAIDTTTAAGRLQLHLFAALAEFERDAARGISLVMPRLWICRA
jgi:small subunit ribosomal protein S18